MRPSRMHRFELSLGLCLLALVTGAIRSDAQLQSVAKDRSYAEDPSATLRVSFEDTVLSALASRIAPIDEEGISYRPSDVSGQAGEIRANSRLSYPARVFGEREGLIQFWIKVSHPRLVPDTKPEPLTLFRCLGERGGIELSIDPYNRLRFSVRRESSQATAISRPVPRLFERMTHITVAWRNDSILAIYVDGALRASTPSPGVGFSPTEATILEISPGTPARWDELQISKNTDQLAYRVKRDFLRTVPLTAIRIDLSPFAIPSDQSLVVGQRKQIGVRGRRADQQEIELLAFGGKGNYEIEGWDARQLIQIKTSKPDIATADRNGGIVGIGPGACRVTVQIGDLTAHVDINVLPDHRPDLSVLFIEQSPTIDPKRFSALPEAGDEIIYYAHLSNLGTVPCPSFRYEWRIIASPTADQKGPAIEGSTLKRHPSTFARPLRPSEDVIVELRFVHPGRPFAVELRLDPEHQIDELSLHNNSYEIRSNARPVHLAVHRSVRDEFRGRFSLTGSVGIEDYLNAHVAFLNSLLSVSVYPHTTPNGVDVRLRIDSIRIVDDDTRQTPPHESYDDVGERGEFVIGSSWIPDNSSGRYCFDLIHEFAHAYLALPDLFCYGVRRSCVYVTGPDGVAASSPSRLPTLSTSPTDGDDYVFFGSINGPEGSVGCSLVEVVEPHRGLTTPGHLMSTNYPRLPASLASHVQFYRSLIRPAAIDSFTRNVPQLRNRLLIQDIDGAPLPGAQLRIFQQTPGPGGCFSAYFPDNPKFIGKTDSDGMWVFPRRTCAEWDDPSTDIHEGSMALISPFSTATNQLPLTPTHRATNSIFLVEIASGSRVAYHFIDIDQFHLSFYTGDGLRGTLYIRTNITLEESNREPIPMQENQSTMDQSRRPNHRPIARITSNPSRKISPGQTIHLDSIKSEDPDGNPIRGTFWTYRTDSGPIVRNRRSRIAITPEKAGTLRITLIVNDGVRLSRPETLEVEVSTETNRR